MKCKPKNLNGNKKLEVKQKHMQTTLLVLRLNEDFKMALFVHYYFLNFFQKVIVKVIVSNFHTMQKSIYIICVSVSLVMPKLYRYIQFRTWNIYNIEYI